jgi:hypothetical protein
MECYWPIVSHNWRLAAIHNVQDDVSLPYLSSRWLTHGYHVAYFDFGMYGPLAIVTETDAADCNFHFDQFY